MDDTTRRQVRAWLEREVALGLDVVSVAVPMPAPPAMSERSPAAAMSGSPPAPAMPAQPTPSGLPAQTMPERASLPAQNVSPGFSSLPDVLVEAEIRGAATLDALREVLGDCERCKLCRGRTNIVFGVGNPSARLMFIGEGPGEDEDRAGEPFVGKAGALLDDIITKGMGLERGDVYIANVVKCRPPNNRNPEPDEIVACEPFLMRQVHLIRPEVVVSLGNFATQALLRDRTAISRRRGRWHDLGGIALMPTFHPAYLLRNPSDKRLVWDDIKLVMTRLGIALPQRGRS